MHLAIRADGSSEIGYGHLMRTSALAQKFLEHGHDVTYLTRTHAEASEVCHSDANVHQLGDNDLSDTLSWLNENAPEILLTDSYDVDTGYQRRLHDAVPTLVTITDDTRFALCCDVNINGNAHAPDLDYNWIGEKPDMFLGTDYLLMREEFRDLADKTPPWHNPPERALVTFGGSDMNNSTPAAIRAFDGFDLVVDVIVGPGVQTASEIEQAAHHTTADINMLRDPDDLPQRMVNADLAVSAAGSTVYELLLTGTPVVGIPQTANQVPITDGLASRDAIISINLADSISFEGNWSPSGDPRLLDIDPGKLTKEVSETLAMLVSDFDTRQKLRERGRSLVDGDGARRIYTTLQQL